MSNFALLCINILLLLHSSLFSLTSTALAEELYFVELEPVVVTASRIEEPISEIPASVSVVTRRDMTEKQTLTLDEALRGVSGLTVQTYGGIDPGASITLRGTENYQSIIMLDGIKINPPYSMIPSGGSLLIGNSERIEVVKGSYSTLYGSEAIGGVINVITTERPGMTYSIAGGTHKTVNGNLLYSGRYKDAGYTFGYGGISTEGFKFSGPYWNNTLMGKINHRFSTTSSIEVSTYYWDWEKYDRTVCCEINGSGDFAFVLDEDSRIREDNRLNSVQLVHAPSEWWDYYIRVATYMTDSRWDNQLDTETAERPLPLDLDLNIKSSRDTIEMQHNFHYGGDDVVTVGLQYVWEWIEKKEFGNLDSLGVGPSAWQPDIRADRFYKAVYLQNLYKIKERLSLTAGLRFESSPGFYNELIPRASALYVIPLTNTQFIFSYGHGFRNPNMKELYHPVAGNINLRPEKSTSIEGGIRQPLMDGPIWLEVTGFALRLKDLIDYSSDPGAVTYVNIGRARINGIESNLRWEITEKIISNIGYTRLSTENRDTGEELPFRPDYKWTIDIRYKPVNELVVDVNTEFTGESLNPYDFIVGLNGEPLSKKVSFHRVVNMAVAYNLIKKDPLLGNLDLTLKLNNIFGEDYEEIPGFPNYGFTFIAGLKSLH